MGWGLEQHSIVPREVRPRLRDIKNPFVGYQLQLALGEHRPKYSEAVQEPLQKVQVGRIKY